MRTIAMFVAATGVLAAIAISSVIAQSQDEEKMFTPQEIKWSPAPPSLPLGAEVALLYGDVPRKGHEPMSRATGALRQRA